jgi:polysaccharide deacetylase family protein (PEP-CTERM system associated)
VLLVNTFDVEPWWATVPPCVPDDDWDVMSDRSEEPIRDYLKLCEDAGVRCTFFFVGWHAQQYPELVREIVALGHEIGCHSLRHRDVAMLSDAEFYADTREAKDILENVAGCKVSAYRAPSFSFPPQRAASLISMLWDIGFRIDSSISTATRIHGGGFDKTKFLAPGYLDAVLGSHMFEVPVPGVTLMGQDMQLFGGGYLRLTPRFLLNQLVQREKYQVMYVHPHDFDDDLPKLPNGSALANLRRSIRLGNLHEKVKMLLTQCEVRSCGELLELTEAQSEASLTTRLLA